MNHNILIVDETSAVKEFYSKIFRLNVDLYFHYDRNTILQRISSISNLDGLIIDSSFIETSDLLIKIKALKPEIVLIVTGSLSQENLIRYIKSGVDDYFENPYKNPDSLRSSMLNMFERRQVERVSNFHKEVDMATKETMQFIGQSESIRKLKKLALKAAPLDATILITGETGTGKEVLAKMIHSLSPNKFNEFITVHCGGIPDSLLESVLFGHEKGAFTGAIKTHRGYFEEADNTTIFLDEIGDTTPAMQVKLLRIVQEKTFRRVGGSETLKTNARIIAATNKNLLQMVQNNEFRMDLYYRLNVITMHLPPLRERPEDILLFIRHFMQIYSKKHNNRGVYLKPETIELMTTLHWPGNVRELENVIERLVALTDTDWIGCSELPHEYLISRAPQTESENELLPYSEAKLVFEKDYIVKLLSFTGGNITKASEFSKIPRQNLHLKLNKHNIDARDCTHIITTTKAPDISN